MSLVIEVVTVTVIALCAVHLWWFDVDLVEVLGPAQLCSRTILRPTSTWQQCHRSGWWRQQLIVTLGRWPLPLLTLLMSLVTLPYLSFIIRLISLLCPSLMPRRYDAVILFYYLFVYLFNTKYWSLWYEYLVCYYKICLCALSKFLIVYLCGILQWFLSAGDWMQLNVAWYGIVEINVSLNTLQFISEMVLWVTWHNQQCHSTEGRWLVNHIKGQSH